MKSSLSVLALLVMSACNASDKPTQASGFILATCPSTSQKDVKRWPVSKHSFGLAPDTSVCSEPSSSGLEIKTPLRIVPYRNDLADLEFSCNHKEAKSFFEKHSGKSVLFVLGGKAIGIARVSDNSFIDRCAILNVSGLEEAISMCETIGTAITKDKEQCWTPCGKNDEGSWACIAHK